MVRTLFLGDLEAQHKVWRSDLEPVVKELDAIVQLGNLISCSPEASDKAEFGRNEAILTLWSKLPQEKALRLIGTNEIAALNFPDQWTNAKSNQLLRDAWLTADPEVFVAAVDKNRLLTHGGLTYGEWKKLGSPKTAQEAADRLEEKYSKTLYQGECFKLDGRPNFAANPIWADPVLELYPSWIMAGEACPFGQIHGNETLNTERGRAAAADKDNILHYLDSVSYRKFGSLATVKGVAFKAIGADLDSETLGSLPADKAFYLERA